MSKKSKIYARIVIDHSFFHIYVHWVTQKPLNTQPVYSHSNIFLRTRRILIHNIWEFFFFPWFYKRIVVLRKGETIPWVKTVFVRESYFNFTCLLQASVTLLSLWFYEEFIMILYLDISLGARTDNCRNFILVALGRRHYAHHLL